MYRFMQKSRSLFGLALLSVLAVGLLGLSSVSAADEDAPYLGVGISPTVRQFELHAGDTETIQMTIRNRTKYVEDFKLYATPYNILDSNYSQPDYKKQTNYSHLAKWVTFEQTEYTLEPEAEITIEFEIIVPDSVPDGTQYAAVFAETTGYREDGKTVGVKAYGRVGMVVKAKMLDGKNIEAAEVTKQNIAWFQPDAPLETDFTIENTGNVEYKVQSRIMVNDLFGGKEKYTSDWVETSTYPESHLRTDIDWDGSKLGVYKVTQEIKMMDEKTVVRTATVLAVPAWVIIVLALGLITLIVNVVLIIVRRRGKKETSFRRSKKDDMKMKR